ncbi:unnamed protein product [Gadus morhua 'NCC']
MVVVWLGVVWLWGHMVLLRSPTQGIKRLFVLPDAEHPEMPLVVFHGPSSGSNVLPPSPPPSPQMPPPNQHLRCRTRSDLKLKDSYFGSQELSTTADHAQEGFPCDCKNKSPLDNTFWQFPHGVLNNLLHNNSPEESITEILFPISPARPPASGEEPSLTVSL